VKVAGEKVKSNKTVILMLTCSNHLMSFYYKNLSQNI